MRATAAATSSRAAPGGTSRPSTMHNSFSKPGSISASRLNTCPDGLRPSAKRQPNTGSCTPNCSWIARAVSPTFQPTRCTPRSRSRVSRMRYASSIVSRSAQSWGKYSPRSAAASNAAAIASISVASTAQSAALRGRSNRLGHRERRRRGAVVKMAGDPPTLDCHERRLLFGATRHRMQTPRMKAAAGRRIQRAWHFASQDDFVLPLVRMARQGSREQRLRVGVLRGAGERARLSLLDNLAEIHDDNRVAHMRHRGEVMRYEQVSEPELGLQFAKQTEDLRPERHFERRDR